MFRFSCLVQREILGFLCGINKIATPRMQSTTYSRRAASRGYESAVEIHLKGKGHSFEGANVHILNREGRMFERAEKDAIFVHS